MPYCRDVQEYCKYEVIFRSIFKGCSTCNPCFTYGTLTRLSQSAGLTLRQRTVSIGPISQPVQLREEKITVGRLNLAEIIFSNAPLGRAVVDGRKSHFYKLSFKMC